MMVRPMRKRIYMGSKLDIMFDFILSRNEYVGTGWGAHTLPIASLHTHPHQRQMV
jgi:hypothetical protein